MAYPVSSRWEQHIRRGATPVTECDVRLPGQGTIFKNLPVSAGSVTFDRDNSYRASGSVTVADPDLFPTLDNPTVLEPHGAEIVIRTGIVYPEGIGDLRAGISASDLAAQGAAELVPVGVFPIQSVSGSEAEGKIAKVDFYDRGRRLEDYAFIAPKDKGGQMVLSVIEEEILDSDPFYPPKETGVPKPGGLHLPDASGDYLTTGHKPIQHLHDVIDIQFDANTDWTSSFTAVAKYNTTGNQRAWAFQLNSGAPRLLLSADGSSTTTVTASSAVAVSSGRWAMRVRANLITGDVEFYESASMDSGWSPLGSTQSISSNYTIFASEANFTVGSQHGGTNADFVGTIHAVKVLSGLADVPLFDVDFTQLPNLTTVFSHNTMDFTTAGGAKIVNEDATGVNWTVTFDPDLDNFPLPAGTLLEQNRWEFLERMAADLGAEIFFYRDGNVIVQPVPGIYGEDEAPEPDWIIDAGEDGILKDADRSVTRDNVFNAVVVVGSADEERAQPYAVVYDDNPNSLTRWGGPFGKALKRVEISDLTTNEQCETAAKAELRNSTGLQRSLGFSAVGNPAMDPGDIIKIVFPDGSSEIHMLDSYSYDFASMDLSADTRSIQYIPPEG